MACIRCDARARNRATIVVAGVVLVLTVPAASVAQVPPANLLPPLQTPNQQPFERPPFETEPPFELPRLRPAPPQTTRPVSIRLILRAVKFSGNTVFSTDELNAIAKPYIDRPVSFSDLEELRLRLTRAYLDRGYIDSGAVIPDQTVTNGTVAINIIEGTLTGVEVSGADRLRPDYVENRVRLAAGPPLNVGPLQERIQILLEDPLIARISAQLGPGLRPGESDLKVQVEERPPLGAMLSFANDRAPSIGSEAGQLTLVGRDLTGFGDLSTFSLQKTVGLQDYAFATELPLTAYDTKIHLTGERTDAVVVEPPFNSIDVEGQTSSIEVGISQPVYRTPDQTFELGAFVAYRQSETFLLGEPFSFSPGVQNGVSKVTVLRLRQNWTDRSRDQVLALRSTFSFGLPVLGATVNPSPLPDTRFSDWLGQAQYARRLSENGTELLLRGDLQLSRDTLLPLEQFAVGGMDSVRGYRQNLLVRDNGLDSSIELRVPIWQPPSPIAGRDVGPIRIAPFVDYGRSWNVDQPSPSPQYIASVGLGLLWDPVREVHAAIYYGYALKRQAPQPSNNLQDHGLYFRLTVDAF
jgi:hemolysin activation/secretion protein